MKHYKTTASTASSDTTKTLIEETTLPACGSRIVGIALTTLGGATITTAEPVTGIVEFESDDIPNLTPMQLPIPQVTALTSGAVALNPYFFPVDIPYKGGNKIRAYITMDMALTGNVKQRVTYCVE